MPKKATGIEWQKISKDKIKKENNCKTKQHAKRRKYSENLEREIATTLPIAINMNLKIKNFENNTSRSSNIDSHQSTQIKTLTKNSRSMTLTDKFTKISQLKILTSSRQWAILYYSSTNINEIKKQLSPTLTDYRTRFLLTVLVP